jgi:hypothetical protein
MVKHANWSLRIILIFGDLAASLAISANFAPRGLPDLKSGSPIARRCVLFHNKGGRLRNLLF